MIAPNLPNEIAFDVSKAGRIVVDLTRLTSEQVAGAVAKGLHEFLKDAHAGVSGDEASRKAVEAKLARLYGGVVPGLGRSGGGRSLTPTEKLIREFAERAFLAGKHAKNATEARKMAQDYETSLAEVLKTARPDLPQEDVDARVERQRQAWQTQAEKELSMRHGPDLGSLID